uniref:Uncharacterized protein n=1 Tax=Arundo donax TaxID=35708 RepID=A0A0A9E4V9_ARUDO
MPAAENSNWGRLSQLSFVPDLVLNPKTACSGDAVFLPTRQRRRRRLKRSRSLIRDHFLPLPLPYNRKRLNAETSAMPTMLTLAAMAQATPPPACVQNRL